MFQRAHICSFTISKESLRFDTQTGSDQMLETAKQEMLGTGRLKMLKRVHTWWRSLTVWSTMGDEVHSGPGVCSNDLGFVRKVPSSANLMGEKVAAFVCCGSVRARLLKAVSMRSAQANVHSENVQECAFIDATELMPHTH